MRKVDTRRVPEYPHFFYPDDLSALASSSHDMTSPVQNTRATRSSLACLPCRSRHLKCDGKRPCCARCAESAQECNYARSRRGGLDRAALAERRKRLAGVEETSSIAIMNRNSSPQGKGIIGAQGELDLTSQFMGANFANDGGLLDDFALGNSTSNTNSPGSTTPCQVQMSNIENDPLIDSYYKDFHYFHPLLLPRRHMIRHYQDPNRQLSLRSLIAAMRLIGYIYNFREWSILLKDHVENCLAQALPSDPVIVQARLLYSIALFWYDHKKQSKVEIDSAIRLALELQIHREEFALQHGADDPVVRESWRRTWWMLYMIDAYYAGTLGTMEFQVLDVDATVGLPCEEQEYESGVRCHTPPLSRILVYPPLKSHNYMIKGADLKVGDTRAQDNTGF